MVALADQPPSRMRIAGSQSDARSNGRSEPRGAERRMFPRAQSCAQVRGKRIDHALPALREPALTLAVRDLSLGGMSAISPTPLERGERLTVTFAAQGVFGIGGAARAGWDAVGRVIRCETSGLGYRIALEFDSVPTAA